jgi:hypothetical protein
LATNTSTTVVIAIRVRSSSVEDSAVDDTETVSPSDPTRMAGIIAVRLFTV